MRISQHDVNRHLATYLTEKGTKQWWGREHPELRCTPALAWLQDRREEVLRAAMDGREQGGT